MPSVEFTRAAFAQDTAEVPLVFLTIDHADLEEPIRVVNNSVNLTSQGNLFVAYPFKLTIPDSREDAASRGRISIDNVSREITERIRDIISPPDVLIQVILASDLDNPEHEMFGFKLRNTKWNVASIEGDIVLEDFTSEPYPYITFSPASAPGLF